mmetsp:Transcript_12428/g.29616  ORF Transcript_12428/g.29616 Transcript_12428/m.29616 type:complete len:331 (+) Transcript_12428:65-1057(+)
MAEHQRLVEGKLPPVDDSTCCCCTVPRNVSDEFVLENLEGDPWFGWWRMPFKQDTNVIDRLRTELSDRKKLPPAASFFPTEGKQEIGYASGEDMMRLMYEATKVPGNWEKVPERLRGVFWMKGNGVGEELIVLQYGQWFEKERTLLVPMAPFSWAWPDGTPDKAPYCGIMYGPVTTMVGARILLGDGIRSEDQPPKTYSLKFDSDDLSQAIIQAHGADVREDVINVGNLLPFLPCCTGIRGKFTLELQPSSSPEPGSSWFRGIFWGCGTCTFLPYGGYQFVKVVRSDGTPNEPYYSEFIKYMGDVRLFVWSDFVGQEATGSSQQPSLRCC